VSHFGAHRLAPTLIDFPEGRFWGHITDAELDALVHRRPGLGTLGMLSSCYRGWGGLRSPMEQVAEREIMMRMGWDWTRLLSAGRILQMDEDGRLARVRLEYAEAAGAPLGAFEAVVEKIGVVIGPGACNHPEQMEFAQYRLNRLIEA